jgi:prepilin-type processing-associated H-X9-DG protein
VRNRLISGSVAGFTRPELFVLLATIGLAGLVGACWLTASIREKRARQCAANLKEIALGFNLWMSDLQASALPWGIRGDADIPDQPAQLRKNSWFQFGSLSNQLKSPIVLADPADRRAGLRRASNWSWSPACGFFHSNYQNRACSYALYLDAGGWNRKQAPETISLNQPLVLDRHFSDSGKKGDCIHGFRQVPSYPWGTQVQWTNTLHGPQFGNIGFLDGSVLRVRSSALSNAITGMSDFLDDSAHYLLPTSNSH